MFVFVAVAYVYFFNGGGWNQNAQFALTRAIVERGSFDITGYRGTEDVGYVEGRIYANKLPGPSLIATVPYSILYHGERLLGLDPVSPVLLSLNGYACTVIVCAIPGALVGMSLFLYGVVVARRKAGFAATVALLVCFGTPLFAYSTVFFRHVPTGAFLLLAFLLGSREVGRPVAAGAFAGLAGLSSYLAMPVILFLAIRAAWQSGWRSAARFLGGGLPFALVLGWYQLATTSSLLTITAAENERFTTEGAFLGFLGLPSPGVLVRILFSEHRGLLFLSPLLLLVVIGLWRLASERKMADLLVVAGSIVWLLAFNASFNGWHGGWAIGPRYLVEGIPVAAVALLYLPRKRWIALTALLTGAVSLVMNFVATAVDPQPPLEILRPFREYLFPVLYGGIPWSPPGSAVVFVDHVNVNPVSLDGTLRRWASFNLGELMVGPGNVLSVALVAIWIIFALTRCMGWWIREEMESQRIDG